MSTLEEAMLLAEGGSGDEENVIIINSDLRTIMSPSNLLLGVYNDKEVLKIPFKMPRFYDGNDLSTFDIFINYTNAMKMTNFDEASDVVIESDSISFNWVTKRSVFVKEGTVRFTICLKLSDSDGNVTKEFNTTVGYGIVLEGIEADTAADTEEGYSIIAHMIQIRRYVDGKYEGIADTVDRTTEELNSTAESTLSIVDNRLSSAINHIESTSALAVTRINTMVQNAEDVIDDAESAVEEIRAMTGYPNQASTAAGMSDQSKIYVYTGSESGYNTGHWYYYKTGSGWTDGGLFMSQGTDTDKTLSISNVPADSKAVGDMMKNTAESVASFHFGFHIDSDGDLCQAD